MSEHRSAKPATFDAKDALRGFIENVQQIRGELWDAISYVPVDSEAADTFARAARRAMDRLDQLDGLMLDAIDKGTEPTLNESKLADTARLDWLEAAKAGVHHADVVAMPELVDVPWCVAADDTRGVIADGATLRQAIDIARGLQPQSTGQRPSSEEKR